MRRQPADVRSRAAIGYHADVVPVPCADLALARRLERAEADSCRRYIEARARAQPGVGAGWIDVDGTYAMFDGVDSPLTQTFGLGLFEPVADEQLERLERFFTDRGATTFHEVSPLADRTLGALHARGYEPFEWSSVLYQSLREPGPWRVSHPVRIRLTDRSEQDDWIQTAAEGWSDTPELQAFMLGFGKVTAAAEGMRAFVAEADGRAIATAAMMVHDGVAILAGASTIPSARGRGTQSALLAARLQTAADDGCDIAMVVTAPGGSSQRNAERNGFRVAYTRCKWRLPPLRVIGAS